MSLERDAMANRGHFTCDSLIEFEEIIRTDLEAERIAIESYGEMISCLDVVDPPSSLLLRQILALEEEHAEIMLNFVAVVID